MPISLSLQAQYFGRNKPSYKLFDYKVYTTPHFEIYYYLKNDSMLKRIGIMSEEWYKIHQVLFRDTFKDFNPIILYNNHTDFQQTNAIAGLIDMGTNGATEAIKNRVVFPIAPTNAQTMHVLGHELVHAFQYHLLIHKDVANLNKLRYLPLWMVEGMAEYFSIGSLDPNTSMWMRDAIMNGKFPSIAQMARNTEYFPYRYGQCFWAMIGKTWGDSLIVPIMRETSRVGYQKALKHNLGYDEKTLSVMWKNALTNHYQHYLDKAFAKPAGTKILFSKNAGDINVSPSVSPDGKYVVFFSEKDLFTFDLYLAELKNDCIIRKLSGLMHHNQIDDFDFAESAGTWSPDSKYFAFTISRGGTDLLAIVDVQKGLIADEYKIPDIPSFRNPSWSPSGDQIVLSGLVEGQTSLYLFDLHTKRTSRLTDDSYSYIQPCWSGDGKSIICSTDKPFAGSWPILKGSMSLGILDIVTKKIELVPVFIGANNLNPLFSGNQRNIYFLSDRDGFRNLYRYSLDSSKMFQLTQYFTGISGITEFSPAVSIAKDLEYFTYSYFTDGKYTIYAANLKDFKVEEVNKDSLNFDAAMLPPVPPTHSGIVDQNLTIQMNPHHFYADSFYIKSYHPKIQLDYISCMNAGIGISQLGPGLAGSIFAMFSDILGHNQLITGIGVNGEIYDFSGLVSYKNSKHPINWGVSLTHTPYLYGSQSFVKDTLLINQVKLPVNNYPLYIERVFEDKLLVFASRAISQTKRIEAGLSSSWNYFRLEVYNYFYDDNNNFVGSNNYTAPVPGGYLQHSCELAFVADNSFMGMTGPLQGQRFRIGLEEYFGGIDYSTFLIDYRKYFFIRPVTLAFRAFQFGRYGRGAEDSRLPGLYLGYPWYIRGYDINTLKNAAANDTSNGSVNNLTGSRMIVANGEIRFPVSGSRKLAPIHSRIIGSDLILFCDAGIAWTNGTTLALKWKPQTSSERTPLLSTGISIRINLFGYMVIEPYYAFPAQYGGFKNPVFGINFVPGW